MSLLAHILVHYVRGDALWQKIESIYKPLLKPIISIATAYILVPASLFNTSRWTHPYVLLTTI